MSRSAGRRFFLFSWERLGRGLLETIVSSKDVPEVLDMKYKSKFKHGFTNRGCLHCAILKALHGFQGKWANKSRDMQFLKLQYNTTFIRAACWINSKISNRDKNTRLIHNFLILSLLLVIIMVQLLKIFKVRLSPSKKNCFISFNESPLKMMKNAFYFILKALLVLKVFKIFWPCKKTRLD